MEASRNLSLDQDAFFQTYDPNLQDPVWKSVIKKMIGWQNLSENINTIIQDRIYENYLDYVVVSTTKAGAFEISVTHNNPKLAAEYANKLMEQIRQLIKQEENESKAFRLSYLAETLADAIQDMEDAQTKLKEYALGNSTVAQENFIAQSITLDNFRMERDEAVAFMTVLESLKEIIKVGDLSSSVYEELRTKSPLVDDVNFRRILGMSETISAWSWPSREIIQNVSDTLKIA